MSIGVIGLGVVGKAVFKAFSLKFTTVGYDKFGLFSDKEYFEKLLKTDMIFVCVPTPTINEVQDISALEDVIGRLEGSVYDGIVVVKCTVLPGTMQSLQDQCHLKLVHNPEFLTAARPFEDFMDQKAIILSGAKEDMLDVIHAYRALFWDTPFQMYLDFKITEMAKYYSNCFLAVKVTFANEIYDLCQKIGCNYEAAKEAAVCQGLIGLNHTKVPGPDGKFGYGLGCLPKETIALQSYCRGLGLDQKVLEAAIEGNKKRRKFDDQCKEIGTEKIVI